MRKRTLLRLLLLAPATACGDSGRLIKVVGNVAAQPGAIDFGDVPVGGTASRMVALSSSGTGRVQLLSAKLADGTEPGLSLQFQATALAPGASTMVEVTFAPAMVGKLSDTLEIATDAAKAPKLGIPITGQGVGAAKLVVSAESIDFGDVLVGTTATRMLTLDNQGTAPLILSSATVADGSNADFVALTPAQATAAPKESLQISVSFTPHAAESATGTLLLGSDDPARPAVSIALLGHCGPRIQVTPAQVAFGLVSPGSTTTQMVDVANPGTAPLHFTARLSATSAAAFHVTGTVSAGVPPSGHATIAIAYAPLPAAAAITHDDGEIEITSDDPTAPLTKVPINGNCNCQMPPPPIAPPCDMQHPTRIWPDRADADNESSGALMGQPVCQDTNGHIWPATGPNSADYFNFDPGQYACRAWKEFPVTPGKELKLAATDESCAGCFLIDIDYQVQELDMTGQWQTKAAYAPAGQTRGYQDMEHYTPATNRLRIYAPMNHGFHFGLCAAD